MRLIDADALKENVPNTNVDIFENCRNCSTLMDWQVKELIDKMPTIDAVEVKHGEWMDRSGGIEGAWNYCSVCGEQAIDLYDFCPNCGAKMQKGEQE